MSKLAKQYFRSDTFKLELEKRKPYLSALNMFAEFE